MSETNINLTISYDGTDFSGWQVQDNVRTVQGVVEKALASLHKEHIPLMGAGRTDAGVHAASQNANFFSGIQKMPASRFIPALNRILPQDVRISGAQEVAPDFHARFSAKIRVYRYYIIFGRQPLPYETRYAAWVYHEPRLLVLNSYARLLRGELDCSLFACPSDPIFTRGSGSKFRFIHNAYFFIENKSLIFEISANAFFRKMVRSIVGTLLFYEKKDVPLGVFKKILEEGRRENAGPTAVPNGLFLWKVEY